jgi:prepilin-type N-terminal cleavage/methylation domain-containing protein
VGCPTCHWDRDAIRLFKHHTDNRPKERERRNGVKSTKLEELRKRLSRDNQKGFTLIELLVVISVLGILAAVVTMSLVGVVSRAQNNANQAEHATVQTALETMSTDQQVDATTAGCTGAIGSGSGMTPNPNMATFPSGGHHLNPLYLHNPATTQKSYTCDTNGQVYP